MLKKDGQLLRSLSTENQSHCGRGRLSSSRNFEAFFFKSEGDKFKGIVEMNILPDKVIIDKSGGGSFYGTGIEIWAGFGPVGITEKNGPIMSNF